MIVSTVEGSKTQQSSNKLHDLKAFSSIYVVERNYLSSLSIFSYIFQAPLLCSFPPSIYCKFDPNVQKNLQQKKEYFDFFS